MANHVHKQLRDAAVTALTGLTTTGANCFGSRVYPLPAATTAALKVYVQSSEAEVIEVSDPAVYQDTVELRVEAVAKAASGFDDTVDQIKKEVTIALSGGLTVGSATVEIDYLGSDVEFDAETEKPVASCVMRFEAVLFWSADAPDVLQSST